jgi:hypothetical protein
MSIAILSLETNYGGATPESKVSFNIFEQVGAFTRIVDTLTLTLPGEYSLSNPTLSTAIRSALVGTTWEPYLV